MNILVFFISHVFKGDTRHFLIWQKLEHQLFLRHYVSEVFLILHAYNLAWCPLICTRFDDLDLVSKSQLCQTAFFRFLSNVVLTLYSCYIHWKDCLQYTLCDSSVYLRQMIYRFLVSWMSGLVENRNIAILLFFFFFFWHRKM